MIGDRKMLHNLSRGAFSKGCLQGLAVAAALGALGSGPAAGGPPWSFTERAEEAGVGYTYALPGVGQTGLAYMGGGVAAADYDGDGWIDLYAARDSAGPNLLFRNRGDGTFEEVGEAAGVDVAGSLSGPLFVDLDNDGWLDLVVGDLDDGPPRVFANQANGTFQEVSRTSGFDARRTLSTAAGDYDGDGDLDLAFSHWNSLPTDGHLWRNQGGFTFADATRQALGGVQGDLLRTFSPNFADFDGDRRPDLAFSSDFGNSQLLLNQGDGSFAATDASIFVDENGMGGAVGDYDNDGDLDWFVSSIWDPARPETLGNRLYRNRGDGSFEDATDEAGVAIGYWGWGACFADLDNDGHLDLFHVNGWRDGVFAADPSRLFIANGDGTFTEQAAALGLDDTGQGRGVACFDYDRDGDIDLFVADNEAPTRLYRNDLASTHAYLQISLRSHRGNAFGIGARIALTSGSTQQVREIRAGSNYVSQNPPEAHFGLAEAEIVDSIHVEWPAGHRSTLGGVTPRQRLTLTDDLIFADGFETGDSGAWRQAVPE